MQAFVLRVSAVVIAVALVVLAVQVGKVAGSRASASPELAAVAAPAPAPVPAAPPVRALPPVEAPAPGTANAFTALEAHVASETRDAWGTRTEAELHTFLANAELPATRLVSASCASTACRVEMIHTSDDDREDVVQALTRAPAFRAHVQVFHRPADPGEVRTVVFLTHPDYRFGRDGRTERR